MLAGSLLWLAACSGPSRKGAQEYFPDLPLAVELQGLPHFPQQGDQCGPASLATLLAHTGISVTPEVLKPAVYLPGRGGSLAVELVAKARQFDRLVYPLRPEVDELLMELASGKPVLVMQNLRFSWWPQWHFAVAIGYDLERNVMLLRSGPDSRYPIDMALFEKTWSRAGGWAVVITSPEQLPVTARALPLMQAAADLEELGRREAAESIYAQALQRWPEHSLALMGLGNTAYARQDYRQAIQFYTRHLDALPRSADGWNNLAYALHHLGCSAAALDAVECAIRLAPEQANYKNSRVELLSVQHSQLAVDCPQTSQCDF